MSRRLVVAGALAAALCSGCKKQQAAHDPPPPPVVAAPIDANPATLPDPDFEKNRAELMRRGNPDQMKTAAVIDASKPLADPADLIKVVSKDVLQVGTIKVDLKRGTADLPARVAAPLGPLEYVIVGTGGKAYESLFTVELTGVELRLALTLLGFEGTVPAADGALAAPTAADTLLVSVRVGTKVRPLADFLIDNRSRKRAPDAPWQVVGFRDETRAAALRTADFMTLVPGDVIAPLRLTIDAGNPYAGPDQGLGMNKQTVPASGSEVTIIFKRRPDAPAVAPPSPAVTNPSGAGTP